MLEDWGWDGNESRKFQMISVWVPMSSDDDWSPRGRLGLDSKGFGAMLMSSDFHQKERRSIEGFKASKRSDQIWPLCIWQLHGYE